MFRKLSLSFLILISLTGCGVQSIPQAKNNVDASLAEITNQYKRRADLIPNLVNVVKGFAKQEKEVFIGVTEARAKATAINIDPSKVTPAQLLEYQKAQGQLSQALGKLMVISENYPQLKSDQNFRDLQAQLEGTENRVTIARQRYILTINDYNNLVTVPPTSWTNSLFYHFEKMPQWDVSADEKGTIEKAPTVNM
jgi:LemA protein